MPERFHSGATAVRRASTDSPAASDAEAAALRAVFDRIRNAVRDNDTSERLRSRLNDMALAVARAKAEFEAATIEPEAAPGGKMVAAILSEFDQRIAGLIAMAGTPLPPRRPVADEEPAAPPPVEEPEAVEESRRMLPDIDLMPNVAMLTPAARTRREPDAGHAAPADTAPSRTGSVISLLDRLPMPSPFPAAEADDDASGTKSRRSARPRPAPKVERALPPPEPAEPQPEREVARDAAPRTAFQATHEPLLPRDAEPSPVIAPPALPEVTHAFTSLLDDLLAAAEAPSAPVEARSPTIDLLPPIEDEPPDAIDALALPPAEAEAATVPVLQAPADPPIASGQPAPAMAAPVAQQVAYDPLAPLKAMSEAEIIALFS